MQFNISGLLAVTALVGATLATFTWLGPLTIIFVVLLVPAASTAFVMCAAKYHGAEFSCAIRSGLLVGLFFLLLCAVLTCIQPANVLHAGILWSQAITAQCLLASILCLGIGYLGKKENDAHALPTLRALCWQSACLSAVALSILCCRSLWLELCFWMGDITGTGMAYGYETFLQCLRTLDYLLLSSLAVALLAVLTGVQLKRCHTKEVAVGRAALCGISLGLMCAVAVLGFASSNDWAYRAYDHLKPSTAGWERP